MLTDADHSVYPRALTERERAWCEYMLPRDAPAYAVIADAISTMSVIGTGRWGEGDLVLGQRNQTIDLRAPMEPVAVYGEISFEGGATLSISIHQPDDEERIEIHFSGVSSSEYESLRESGRWAFSHWSPGMPSPGGTGTVREVPLDDAGELVLAIDPQRRLLWMYDARLRGITLIPVTNFYNELMLVKGVRDPAVALEHRRLFSQDDPSSDVELRAAFARYNMTFRKVDTERVAPPREASRRRDGLFARVASSLRGGRR